MNSAMIKSVLVASQLGLILSACSAQIRSLPPAVKKHGLTIDIEGMQFSPQSGDAVPAELLQFEAVIDGCASGYRLAFASPVFVSQIQEGDTGCQFRLLQAVVRGQTLDFSQVPDTSWAEGSSFVVTGSGGTPFTAMVVDQIDSPVTSDQNVRVSLSSAFEDDSQSVSPSVPFSAAIGNGEELPLGLISFTTSVSVAETTTGFGLFRFRFQCLDEGGATGAGGDLSCGSFRLAGLPVGLAIDVSNGEPLTLEECLGIAESSGAATQALPPGSSGVEVGGADSGALLGPGALYDPAFARLIFAVSGAPAEAPESKSCMYLRVSVPEPT